MRIAFTSFILLYLKFNLILSNDELCTKEKTESCNEKFENIYSAGGYNLKIA